MEAFEKILYDMKDDGVLRVDKIEGKIFQISWASASESFERPDGSTGKTKKGLHTCRICKKLFGI